MFLPLPVYWNVTSAGDGASACLMARAILLKFL